MEVKVASSSPQSLAFVFSSITSKRTLLNGYHKTLTYQTLHQTNHRSLSLTNLKGRGRRINELTLRRAFSDSLEGFTEGDDESDDDFINRLHILVSSVQPDDSNNTEFIPDSRNQAAEISNRSQYNTMSVHRKPEFSVSPPWPAIKPEQPSWLIHDEIIPVIIENKAKSADLPLSLRMIKKKKRWENGFIDVGESACSSIKKAFSSMVFIVREVQSYTLQMREIHQGILARVQGEMNASFVWLFQQIFYCTPTLMVYIMLLLANFTVYSISNNSAFAAAPPQSIVTTEQQEYTQKNLNFHASSIKTFSVGRTASVNGNGNDGGKVRPVAGATDDGRFDRTLNMPRMVTEEEEATIWNKMVENINALHLFMSPVTVELEPEDYVEYLRTEITYHQAVSQDPDNTLLLCNFAQFLYVVLHDLDRAEYYFKRAVGLNPVDSESLSKYANFLWLGRKDLLAAEESYLEAIAADPSNSYHAANYANFLWNSGGEDTCYPLE